MHQASVGFHCPDCARSGRQQVRIGAAAFHVGFKPILTYILIGLNVLVFLVGVVIDGAGSILGEMGRMQIDFGLIAGFDSQKFQVVGVAQGEWYRIISSGFLHYGLFHIAVNMYALYILGMVLEAGVGRLRMGMVYAVSLIAGSLGALIVSPNDLTVGASGAIFGLMGGLMMAMRAQGVSLRDSPLLPTLALNLGLTLFFSRYISVGGHVGGFIGGLVAGWVLFDVGRRPGLARWVPLAVSGALAVGCFVGAMLVAGAQ